jgi:phage shock protein A
MSSKDTEELINKTQADIEAYDAQVQQAQDRDDNDMVPGLMAKRQELTNQLQRLQSKMTDQQRLEAHEQAEKAREEQKKKDDVIGRILG